ncbi:hypothetical protein VPH35_063419 [Triticum aestivum]|uniref:Uncharacterized protein n=1 Tax=Aegilops tauschii subsp. strangulata TaxID=200361 RepID=A0A453GPH2_AEGTS
MCAGPLKNALDSGLRPPNLWAGRRHHERVGEVRRQAVRVPHPTGPGVPGHPLHQQAGEVRLVSFHRQVLESSSVSDSWDTHANKSVRFIAANPCTHFVAGSVTSTSDVFPLPKALRSAGTCRHW